MSGPEHLGSHCTMALDAASLSNETTYSRGYARLPLVCSCSRFEDRRSRASFCTDLTRDKSRSSGAKSTETHFIAVQSPSARSGARLTYQNELRDNVVDPRRKNPQYECRQETVVRRKQCTAVVPVAQARKLSPTRTAIVTSSSHEAPHVRHTRGFSLYCASRFPPQFAFGPRRLYSLLGNTMWLPTTKNMVVGGAHSSHVAKLASCERYLHCRADHYHSGSSALTLRGRCIERSFVFRSGVRVLLHCEWISTSVAIRSLCVYTSLVMCTDS